MKRLIAFSCVLLLAASPSPPKRLEKTLPNGVHLIVQQRGSVPWCALTTVLPGGSHTDPEGLSGLAHLAEHLMFEEADGTNLDADAEALGMRSNAFTLTDYTILVEEFSPAVMDDAIRIHAARMRPPVFSDEQLKREQHVVADERRFRVDEPALASAEELVFDMLWSGHAWGRPVLGWPQDVNRASRDDVIGWTRLRVRPEKAFVALVGAVDPERAMGVLERVLGAWKAPASVVEMASAAPPDSAAKHARKDVAGSIDALLWAAPASKLGDPHEAADHILAMLLDVDPGRRVAAPREDWPAIEVRAEYRPQWHVGEFLITVTPHELATLDESERILTGYLELLAHEGPHPPSLEAVRAKVLADHAREYELHAALAERMALDGALLHDVDAEGKRIAALKSVSVDDVKDRAAALLAQKRRAVVRVHGPGR